MLKFAKQGADIGIVVSNVATQTRFYGETLGLQQFGKIRLPNGTLHIYSCGDSLLKLYAISGAAIDLVRGEFGSRIGLAYITINLTNIDEAFDDVVRAGVTVVTPLSELDTGIEVGVPGASIRVRYAMLADPEGNRVELLQRLT